MKKTIGTNDNFIFNLHCLGLRKHVNDGARQMHVTFRNCLASFSNEAQKHTNLHQARALNWAFENFMTFNNFLSIC